MKYTRSLKGSINFKRVLKQGKYASAKNITIYIKKINSLEDANLLGICVSKKHGNSVVRNKLKRWARESYYTLEESVEKNYSIVVLFKKGIDVDKLSFNVVKDEMRDLFIKIDLLHE